MEIAAHVPRSLIPGSPMRRLLKAHQRAILCSTVLLGLVAAGAEAAVVVLENRTDQPVPSAVVRGEKRLWQGTLRPGGLTAVPVSAGAELLMPSGPSVRRIQLGSNRIYRFIPRDGELEIAELDLSTGKDVAVGPEAQAKTPRAADEPGDASPDAIVKIPVMLLVDDEEPTVRRAWENRLRKRLAEASAIFERDCRIGFEVVAVGTWDTDDKAGEFEDLLREFELEVLPAPARLALGFTSQYQPSRRQRHIGGIRGPLRSHALICEFPQHVTEPQRLEILLHELGHYLGAVHTDDPRSLMRPSLGPGRVHARAFRLGFDAVNTLILNVVADELRAGRAGRFGDFSPEATARLREGYAFLAERATGDDTAEKYIALLDRKADAESVVAERLAPLAEGTRSVVQAIAEAARWNRTLPDPADPSAQGPRRASGDKLTELYIRRAAAAAERLPPEVAGRAYLMGLAIGVDHSSALRGNPFFETFCRQVESDAERARRLADLAGPTVQGRRDLAQHFVVSCGLTASAGPRGAEALGLAKEIFDSQRGSGFSFADLAADLAGIQFAEHVLEADGALEKLARSFTVEGFIPEVQDLPEGIGWREFQSTYGSTQDDRFREQREAIERRIAGLPAYR